MGLLIERDTAGPWGLKENKIWDTITSEIYAETAKDCESDTGVKQQIKRRKEAMVSSITFCRLKNMHFIAVAKDYYIYTLLTPRR